MQIIIASQDIREFSVGLLVDGKLSRECSFAVAPEGHLSIFISVLEEWGVAIEGVEGVVVVTGPGSFTASRVSVGLANVLAFTQSIPVRGLVNPDRLSLADLVDSIDFTQDLKGFVMPSYDRPPHTR